MACSAPDIAREAAAAVLSVLVTNERRVSSFLMASPEDGALHHNLRKFGEDFVRSCEMGSDPFQESIDRV